MLGIVQSVCCVCVVCVCCCFVFFQAEDGIRDLVRSRGLGDVYKRQVLSLEFCCPQKSQYDYLPSIVLVHFSIPAPEHMQVPVELLCNALSLIHI